jgi:phosphopantetheinyl transferase (holo-ACP synthase)
MDGNLTIDPEDFAKYLGRMLGRSIELDAVVQLTSGQQARAASWLAERGLGGKDLRSRLSTPFRPTTFAVAQDGIPQQSPMLTVQPPIADLNGEILRVGIDIQRVDELLPELLDRDLKSSSEVTAMFTLREISYAQSRPTPLDTLCGLFAAKEALRKCDSALLTRPLKELEILPNTVGQPEFRGFAVSISHSGGFAIAVAAKLSAPISLSKGFPGGSPSQVSLPTPSVTQVAEPKLRVNWTLLTLLSVVVLACGTLILKLFDVIGFRH